MDNLSPEADLYKEYHALLISHAKAACLKKPICNGCPLNAECTHNNIV
jgi:endonuclease-3 related protein